MSFERLYDYLAFLKQEIVEHPKKVDREDAERYKRVIEYVFDKVAESDGGYQPEKIANAIKILEKIRLIGIIDKYLTDKACSDHPEHSILSTTEELETEIWLPNSYTKEVLTLHALLLKCYLPHRWEYRYPLNANHEVMNPAIQQWQENSMLLNSQNHALSDFTRGFTIFHPAYVVRSQTDIVNNFSSLIKDSQYLDEDKTLLNQWMQRNSGQDINRFIDLLLEQKEFSNDAFKLGLARANKSEWSLQEGKLHFSYDGEVNSLFLDTENEPTYLYMKPCNITKVNEDRGYVHTGSTGFEEAFSKHTKKEELLAPLMRIKAEMELEILHKNAKKYVKPKITSLVVTGYTHLLTPRNSIDIQLMPKANRL